MRDFIRACKGGDPACSNFEVASPFVEWMLLGVIALHKGKLEYDPDKMRGLIAQEWRDQPHLCRAPGAVNR